MKRLSSFIILIGATFLLMLPESFSASLELKDALGTSFTFSSPPRRIVSLAPSLTESLYLLGAGERIVGVTIFADIPAEVKEKEKVGTMLAPGIEKIVSLNPDLVLITQEGNRPQTMDKLRRLGVKVFVIGESKSFSDIGEHFLLLGKVVGQEKKAEGIMAKASGKIIKVRETVGDLPPVRVFWQIGADPIITVAEGTFIDEMIRMAGGINIARRSRIRYPRYSREAVIKENPQVIFLVTTGEESARHQEEEWRRFRQLKSRIYHLDPNLVHRPTPLAFAEGLEKVAELLHPETPE